MKKTEFFGIITILMLLVFLIVYETNSINTITNNFKANKLPPSTSPTADIMVTNMSIGKISDGYWYINATIFATQNTNYVAMYTIWYDSSGNVLSEKNLVWNKSNLESQQNYPISTLSNIKDNATPSEVEILFFDSPSATNNDSQAFLTEEIKNGSISWNG